MLPCDPLNLVERYLIAAPVIESSRPGRLVRGHLLGDLEPAAVLEVGSDAGGPEGVAADLGFDSCRERPPANHPPDIRLKQGITHQQAGADARRAEERPFPVLGREVSSLFCGASGKGRSYD
jgi:hypothetical protein